MLFKRNKLLNYEILISILFLFISTSVIASDTVEDHPSTLPLSFLVAESEGCRSCVSDYDCSKINKTCNATCQARLFTASDDLESCRLACIGKLEKCLANARKACSFYCKSE